MAIELTQLWDFAHPERSEERFRAALLTASGDDRLILQTQIARTFGLRGNFAHAQEILTEIAHSVEQAGGAARAQHALEWGRTLSSAVHTPESQTKPAREAARAAFVRALTIARAEELDGLAIDALHMLAFVDSAPAEQLNWGMQALTLMEASSQSAAWQWEGALRNNVGYALPQLGRYAEALVQFELALAWRERTGSAESIHIARWMVAWTLRFLERNDEALALQLRLEQTCAAAGAPDPYVFEELEHLYRARHDTQRADAYAARRLAMG
jgi:tetratricopeptide (TPR) repeat protein